MSTRKVKIGIIGCGKVAHLHAAGLQQGNNTELTALTVVRSNSGGLPAAPVSC